ncbi:MAG: glycerate kinase [Aquamicrobium sp.]|uniref:glycerate kinase type-2 family protein n=1 Tax=Aquamicrobium sp. TaxID=1872579 RepID=UPI00349EF6CD|nr:glycerate kinase [Aquamicrobium sp.]
MTDPRTFFTVLFEAAVAAADPAVVIRDFLPGRPKGRVVVVGAGKASVPMAAAFDAAWDGPLTGIIVTRHGQGGGRGGACGRIAVLEAAHPVPDEAGLEATARLFDAVRGLGPDDLVVALISGGGSALLPWPPPGMSLADEIAVNEALLASGAPISAMNTVRKHLSAIKGGWLALAAHPAKVVTLVVSDIPGDNPAFVASGPTVADGASRRDALAIVAEYGLALPDAAMRHLATPAADAPLPDDPRLAGNEVHVIASAARSLEAAARAAARHGVEAVILSDSIEGEARDVAGVHAAIAREIALRDRPFRKPVVLLSGGETTVTMRSRGGPGGGRGGRNGEFLLAFALAVDGHAGIHAFAADTDGIDGTGDNAGAFADGTSAGRMRAAGLDPRAALARNDAFAAFAALGDLFSPGPTGTNVNDLRAVLVR